MLKINGFIYAETPFLQAVHEAAFDFTRFTESGHRYAFKAFECLESGYLKGAGTSLIWSLDFFFTGLFRTRWAGRIVRLLFFWLQIFDLLIPPQYNIDAANGVFFWGRKTGEIFKKKDIVRYYKGGQ